MDRPEPSSDFQSISRPMKSDAFSPWVWNSENVALNILGNPLSPTRKAAWGQELIVWREEGRQMQRNYREAMTNHCLMSTLLPCFSVVSGEGFFIVQQIWVGISITGNLKHTNWYICPLYIARRTTFGIRWIWVDISTCCKLLM